jgi:hypothetical protein
MEEIASLWDRFSLTAKEEARVDLSGEQGDQRRCVGSKILYEKGHQH